VHGSYAGSHDAYAGLPDGRPHSNPAGAASAYRASACCATARVVKFLVVGGTCFLVTVVIAYALKLTVLARSRSLPSAL